jgi:uncharacterized repeat protein (TIGR01451 family)
MMQKNSPFHLFMRLVRSYWIGIVAIVLAVLVLLANQAAWAAPLNQTVPPKPTDTPTSAPQATNTPRDEDEEEEEEQQPPTSTPTPTPGQPAQPQDGELTGVVTAANRLNVREGPGTDFAPVGTVARDETVRILERNEAGTWWRICCVSGTTTEGWVSAQYIRPNFDAAQANTLIPVADAAPASAPTEAPTLAPTVAPTEAASTTAAEPLTSTLLVTSSVSATTATGIMMEEAQPVTPTFSLELAISQDPAFAQQGDEVELQFVVTNSGNTTALNVEVRNELAPELTFIAADPGDGSLEEQTGNEDRFVFSIRWPELGPGESVTASVTVQIAEEVADGAVIDNLAVASADNAAPYTAGISIGLPPTMLPDFQ